MACSVAERSPPRLCNCGHSVTISWIHEEAALKDTLRQIEVSGPMKIATGLSIAVEKPSSNATHEPHNHQNHNNCSEHTHT